MVYKVFSSRKARNMTESFLKSIMDKYDLSYYSAVLLSKMGFSTINECDEFLFAKEKNLINPLLFNDMQKIILRMKDAVLNNEKIAIYSDYDCDGICGGVILKRTLDLVGAISKIYIPSRFSHGYGLNMDDIDKMYEEGATLIVTVDNGIVANSEAEYIKNKNIDLIITDHHTPGEILPKCLGILCPKIKGERYPFKELCGSGVAFKLSLVLLKEFLMANRAKELLSYTALATIADMVPLTGENRTIVSLGIREMNENCPVGLKALIEEAGYKDKKIESGIISFQLAPRINAPGRIGEVDNIIGLLLCDDVLESKKIAKEMESINEHRRRFTEETVEKCCRYIEKENLLAVQKVLFVAEENLPKGIVGLAAGKLAEKYARPCVVLSIDGESATGSARSVKNFDIYSALTFAKDYFTKFGGHKAAAGMSLQKEDIGVVADIVNKRAETLGIDDSLIKTSFYDTEALASVLTQKAVGETQLFAPFGIANPKPLLLARDVKLDNVSFIGSDKSHVKMNMVFDDSVFSAIYFSGRDEILSLDTKKETYDVIFSTSINTYMGSSKIQLEVSDIAPAFPFKNEYYESLYGFFLNDTHEMLHREEALCLNKSVESIIDTISKDDILVTSSLDALVRAWRYLRYKNIQVNISFSFYHKKNENQVVDILVCPQNYQGIEKEKRLIFLEGTAFGEYPLPIENEYAIDKQHKSVYVFPTKIDREFVLTVYRGMRTLSAYDADISQFVRLLRRNSQIDINIFVLRLCLDVMKELEILDYTVYNNKLGVNFAKVDTKRNIEDSSTIQKLRQCYEKLIKE